MKCGNCGREIIYNSICTCARDKHIRKRINARKRRKQKYENELKGNKL